mmetsp:Transcript_3509/g.7883  ORF Transcript_3509/g.7883 Transcript_3509/m.7883 type:complete len:639 (-) Transcript_3509:354-2270(-)
MTKRALRKLVQTKRRCIPRPLLRHGHRHRRHPFVFGAAAISLLATALPSCALGGGGGNLIPLAFAASASSSSSSVGSFGSSRRRSSSSSASSLPFGISSKRSICNSRSAPVMMTIRGGGDAEQQRLQQQQQQQQQQQRQQQQQQAKPKQRQYPHAPIATVSPFSRPVKKVVVVGGTHGNEYTGVWCIKSIERQRELFDGTSSSSSSSPSSQGDPAQPVNVFASFPSLDVDTLLANPVAHMQNKRFVEADLNREFSIDRLKRVAAVLDGNGNDDAASASSCDVATEFCSTDEERNLMLGASLPHEALRAREIEALLGPKILAESNTLSSSSSHDVDGNSVVPEDEGEEDTNPAPLADIVIDLHTTTCNMGISLIIPEGDALMSAAAAYVMHSCRAKYGYPHVQILMHALPKRKHRMNLSSCGRHGFTVEVGPVPQGVLRHDVVEKTEAALHSLLEFLHLRNLELENEKDAQTKEKDEGASRHSNVVEGDATDSPPTTTTVLDRLRRLHPGGTVPCYRSAPAVRPGELSGKISWPTDPTNPNFPAVVVHKSVQDRDFEPLRVGDPLFLSLDGKVIPYDGSHGEEVHLIFVNEGGYYYASSGTGIGVAVKSQFDWETGWFVIEEDGGESEEVVVDEEDSYE